MKTQNELIEYYSKQLTKVISAHGVTSDYTNHAFFLLQGAKIGLTESNIFSYATNKMDDLKNDEMKVSNNEPLINPLINQRPLPKGTIIEYAGVQAEVINDDGSNLIDVIVDDVKQEWFWIFEDIECTVVV